MTTWSILQQQAISKRSPQLLVSAGAGSGKTSVLVERVLTRILEDGMDLDQMLVVTFTEAAAAEMKARIEEALYTKTKVGMNKRAASQLQRIDHAQISTLHSFCLSVLRLGAVDLPVAPGFRIADGNEAAMVLEEVLTEWFDEWLMAQEEHVDFALRHGEKRGDQGLRKWLKQLYHNVRSQPDSVEFLDEMVALYLDNANRPLQDMIYADLYANRVYLQVNRALRLMQEAERMCHLAGGPDNYVPKLQSEIELIRQLLHLTEKRSFSDMSSWKEPFSNLPPNRVADKTIKERIQKNRKDARKLIADLHLGERTPGVLEQQVKNGIADVRLLASMLADFSAAYQAQKRMLGIVDFQDLEHMAYDLLRKTDARSGVIQELSGKYQEIMVDEYQDTSPLQDAILQQLATLGEPIVFLVGDVKQSIYRFRMAEPGLFLQKAKAYLGSGNVIDMNENYRSRKEVVDAVNLLFGQLFTPVLGGLVYDDSAKMVPLANYPQESGILTLAAKVELHLVESGRLQIGDEDEPDDGEGAATDEEPGAEHDDLTRDDEWIQELEKMQREGLVIASRIMEMMNAGHAVYDASSKKYRPLEYRDFAILLRADRSRIDTLLGVLRKQGIPAAGNADSGFFAGYEIRLAHALLHVVDNPQQDIPFISVLRSFIGGFSSKELALTRSYSNGNFYEALCELNANEPASDITDRSLWEKAHLFLARLEDWRTVARTLPLPEAVSSLLRDGGLLAYFKVAPGGAVRIANLSYLERMASVYDSVGSHYFSKFVSYLDDHLENSELDLGGASVFSEHDNVVRLMTIHKSKGLEFPVVFVAGLGNQFNTRHDSTFYLHRKYGFGMKETRLDQRERIPTLTSMALQELDEKESLAEEARVLYVAMTRARERLVLLASAKGTNALLQQAMDDFSMTYASGKPLTDDQLLQAKRFLDWLLPAIFSSDEGLKYFSVKCWDKVEDFERPNEVDSDLSETTQRLLQFDPSLLAPTTPEEASQMNVIMSAMAAQMSEGDASSETNIYAKVSVTEWRKRVSAASAAHREEMNETNAEEASFLASPPFAWTEIRPRFVQGEKGLTPTEMGTLWHLFMQQMKIQEGTLDEAWFEAEWKRVISAKGVEDQPEIRDLWKWGHQFFSGPLGTRVWQARDFLKREVPFTLSVQANTLDETADERDKVVVQGVVDTVFEEAGELVIVDYKTDRLGDHQKERELAEKYAIQLHLYADAMAKGYHKPVKEAWLYFARHDLPVRVIG